MVRVEPVLHLSVPVSDVAAAKRFYVQVLGCEAGRMRDDWGDVWFYGLQLTLQERPAELLPPDAQGVRHFGVTLAPDELEDVVRRLDQAGVRFLASLEADSSLDGKTGVKVQDPSGNVIELKAYPRLDHLRGTR